MKDNKILELKKEILEGKADFLDIIAEVMTENKILYSDNYCDLNEVQSTAMSYLESFMQLLYRGSKHSTGSVCESGFSRVIVHKDVIMKFTYYSGPEIYVSVERLDSVDGIKPIVTIELLCERLTEAEAVKSELAPIIEKYLKAGLTFEEITKMLVEIMRENRIKL